MLTLAQALLAPALAGEPGGEAVWVLGFAEGEDPAALPTRVEALGLGVEVEAVAALLGSPSGPLVQVRAPAEALPALGALPGVRWVAPPALASPKAVRSEGVDELLAPAAGALEGLTGRGVRVAVLDVGFWGAGRLAGEELPADLVVEGGEGGTAHGTAVAELIADLAPEAELRLYRLSTHVEFIAALEQARRDRVDLISASVGFDNAWAVDGSSPMSQAVDEAWADGVPVFLAAGNEVGNYWAGPLTDADGDGWLELGGVEGVGALAWGLEAEVRLRWDEPFGAAEVDLALVLLDEAGRECARGDLAQQGADLPLEEAACAAERVEARVAGGPEAWGLHAWLYAPGGVDGVAPTEACTLTLPADARGAVSVGAYRAGGLDLEAYSSQGPTEDGRLKPELVGPSGVSTASLGERGFYGSSAATPHVAGLGALLLEHDRRLDPEALRAWLLDQAEDLGPPGWDPASGAGAARAGELPPGCGCASSLPPGSPLGWVFAGILLRARRRRAKLAGTAPTL